MTVLTQFCAPAIVGIFENDTAVIRLGSQYLRAYVWDCIFAGVHFCFSGYFCACELSVVICVVAYIILTRKVNARSFPQ